MVGVSPKKDAQVQLSLAGQTEPTAALRQFLGQEGVQAGRSGQTTINGNSATNAGTGGARSRPTYPRRSASVCSRSWLRAEGAATLYPERWRFIVVEIG